MSTDGDDWFWVVEVAGCVTVNTALPVSLPQEFAQVMLYV
jgi:hypothetical protein